VDPADLQSYLAWRQAQQRVAPFMDPSSDAKAAPQNSTAATSSRLPVSYWYDAFLHEFGWTSVPDLTLTLS
jgi:hypothetical protein